MHKQAIRFTHKNSSLKEKIGLSSFWSGKSIYVLFGYSGLITSHCRVFIGENGGCFIAYPVFLGLARSKSAQLLLR
jgi:hypothetical protein